jgi:hypothetical protein
MKTGDNDNPGFLDQKEYPVRERANPGPPPVFIDHRELQRRGSYRLDRVLYRLNESRAQLGTDGVIMREGLPQLRVGLRQPDYGQSHRPLCRSALTCSHGMTSAGFSRYRAAR